MSYASFDEAENSIANSKCFVFWNFLYKFYYIKRKIEKLKYLFKYRVSQFFTNEQVKDLSEKAVKDWKRELIEKTGIIVEDMKRTKLTPHIYSEHSYPKFKEAVKYLHIPGPEKIDGLVIKSKYKNKQKNYIQLLASCEECV